MWASSGTAFWACGWRSPDVPTRNRNSGLRSSMPRRSGCEGTGIVAVSAGSNLPLMDRDVPHAAFVVDGTEITEPPPFASVRFVDADYIAAIADSVRRGRAFTLAEARSLTDRAVMINETMARRYWRDRDPINTRVRLIGAADVEGWYTVVGVVGDVSQRQIPAQPENRMYLPLAPARELTLMVRAAADPAAIAGHARDAVHSVDPSLSGTRRIPSVAVYAWYSRDRRLQGVIIGILGVWHCLLAALGVYSVMSLLVTQRRTRDRHPDCAGILQRGHPAARAWPRSQPRVGWCLCGRPARMHPDGVPVVDFLGLRAFNPAVVGAAAALLATVAVVASWWPARRGMQVDPMVTLNR